MRSGFVAVAGRPNVGKSTLVNALTGSKVAIVSDKPHTTRHQIRGVYTTDEAQLVVVDLPGWQKPIDPLTERMQERVDETMAGDLDAVLHSCRERVDRLLPAGQVDEHELRVVTGPDAADPMPGRVRDARHDRHLLARERVDERRLADVRAAGDGDEARLHPRRSQAFGRSSSGETVRMPPSVAR